MVKIIRHSDDLGITHQSTIQLLDAWRAGYLDSFSIIANGDAIELIPERLACASELPARIAIHFNLTEGYPSSPSSDIPLLVDNQGMFYHTFGSLMLTFLFVSKQKKHELSRQIARECKAQIMAVQSLCGLRRLRAIDGHNHIHMIPGVFNIVAQCATEENIPEIRISAEPFYLENFWRDIRKAFWWVNLIKHSLLRFLSVSARQTAQFLGLHSPDVIVGVLYSGKMSANRALCGIKAATAIAATEIEVVFHIGRAHAAEAVRWRNSNYATFHLSKWRDVERAEIALFTDILCKQESPLGMR